MMRCVSAIKEMTVVPHFMIAVLFLLLRLPLFAQHAVPLVKATSKTVTIRDGNHLKTGYWAVLPEKKPDCYFVELPQKAHPVTFITDQDSISFDVVYGNDYDFIILLNGKDSCYTRISARYNNLNTFIRGRAGIRPDTIPFTLGDNRKIYVQAKLNGATIRNIQLDMGAGGTVINKASVGKVKMNFDQKVTLANSDGVNLVSSASKNVLQIGKLVWDSVSIAVAGNMKENEDLIIGNSLFKDKILEINYNNRLLVVHDTLPPQVAAYSRHDLILDGGTIPYIVVSLTIRNKTQTGWVMFDTGARTSILNSEDVSMPLRIMTELADMIGLDDAIVPKLRIGNYQLSGFEYKTRQMGTAGLNMILGNDLLRRFNLVFDNKNGYLYMQPNVLTNAPYGKRDEYYVVRGVVAVFLIIAFIVIFKKVRKKPGRMGETGSRIFM
ncbi:aspartyl protease family protein [Niabella pedocola]|uniref:Aspartyl protease family protein n=1 Tax=Niabella pedocola TaxID=1752077 RepID=A0ABS8PLW6_9BACT|nr:aspartyl protease family protein [Niabella pedocola]MCD2422096.1 aspartyl protease family protein [Niabella pedocola]